MRLLAGDDPARLALVNTWRPLDRTQKVDLVPALLDQELQEQAISTLFYRFQKQLLAGEALPNVRGWLRADVEVPLLSLMVAANRGSVSAIVERRQWLVDAFQANSPYYPAAIRLQAQAALSTGDRDWALVLLSEHSTALQSVVRFHF